MNAKKKGIISLIVIAAVMLILMLASGGIYNALSSIGRHNVVPTGNSFTAGSYEGVGQGKMGDVKLKLTLSDTMIEKVEVVENSETPDIAGPAFDSMPAAMVEHQTVYDVDDVSGATVTSHAIKEAAAAALAKAGVDAHSLVAVAGGASAGEAGAETEGAAETEADAASSGTEAEAVSSETEAEEAAAAESAAGAYADGVYEGTGTGRGGDLNVEVTVENGKISDIVLKEGHSETPGIYEMAVDQVIPAIIENQSTDVDAAAGASLTSEGIKMAVEDALSKAAAGGEAADAADAAGSAEGSLTLAEGQTLTITAEPGSTVILNNYSDTAEEAAEEAGAAETAAVAAEAVEAEAKAVEEAEEAEEAADTAAAAEAAYVDGVYEGSGNGNGGELNVEVTVENGMIKDIVLEEGHMETPGIYELAVNQVIPAIIDKQSVEVDAAAGASMTSKGIKEAVADALSKASQGASEADAAGTAAAAEETEAAQEAETAAETEAAQEAETAAETEEAAEAETAAETEEAAEAETEDTAEEAEAEEAAAPAIYKYGIYEGSGEGKGGELKVKVTVENGVIRDIVLLDGHQETPGIFEKAVEQVIPAIIENQSTDVDAAAGATLTSEGIKAAVEEALSAALGKDSGLTVAEESTAQAAEAAEEEATEAEAAEEEATEAEEAEEEAEKETAVYSYGIYEGSGNGKGGELKVKVTVENGMIKDIKLLDGHAETPGIYENAVEQVIPAIIESQSTAVDAATGATLTSEGIMEAVKDALSKVS